MLSVVPLTKYVDDTEHWTLECWSFVRLCKDHTSIDTIDKHWSLCMPFELWFVGFIGLGTSTAKEAKEYFSDMARHRIPFKYSNTEDDTAIELVGSVTYSNMYPKFCLLVVLWHVTYSVCWYCRPKILFMKFLILWHCVARWGDGGGGHWLVRMEWHPAGWSVCLLLLIFPCSIKSRRSFLALAHLGGPGKRAVNGCGVVWWVAHTVFYLCYV